MNVVAILKKIGYRNWRFEKAMFGYKGMQLCQNTQKKFYSIHTDQESKPFTWHFTVNSMGMGVEGNLGRQIIDEKTVLLIAQHNLVALTQAALCGNRHAQRWIRWYQTHKEGQT